MQLRTHGSPAKAVASFGARAALGPIDAPSIGAPSIGAPCIGAPSIGAPVPPSMSSQLPQWKCASAGLGRGAGSPVSQGVWGCLQRIHLIRSGAQSAHTPVCLAMHGFLMTQ